MEVVYMNSMLIYYSRKSIDNAHNGKNKSYYYKDIM